MNPKTTISLVALLLAGLLLLVAPLSVQAQFEYTTNGGSLTVVAYSYDGPVDVAIPATANGLPVTGIGDEAFADCDITSVTIPANVGSIAGAAFYFCIYLTNVTLADGVTNIGDGAFYGCVSLSSIDIPASVVSVGGGAPAMFYDCSSLTAINVDTNNAFFSSSNGVMFDKTRSTLVEYPAGLAGVYSIPSGVTDIAPEAFVYCAGLTAITIPPSVTNLGDYAFAECKGLTSVYFTGDAPAADSTVFYLAYTPHPTVYYLANNTGWGSTFAGVPAAPWNMLIQVSGANFGVSGDSFGFNITGTTNISVVVEACTNLASPVWNPLQTLTLTAGSIYFSEPLGTNLGGRYYRIRSPF